MGTQIKFIAIQVILWGKFLVVFGPENSDILYKGFFIKERIGQKSPDLEFFL
jgi:hypothetical protein